MTAATVTLEQFGLDRLTADERVVLAQALWDSVHEAMENAPISPELEAELLRRVALSDADPSRGVPWEEVREAARKRRGQK